MNCQGFAWFRGSLEFVSFSADCSCDPSPNTASDLHREFSVTIQMTDLTPRVIYKRELIIVKTLIVSNGASPYL